MRQATVWYSTNDDPGSRYEVALDDYYRRAADDNELAEMCAGDYHSNHDGWESSWPLGFMLYASEEGPMLFYCEVEIETQPHFYAGDVVPSPPSP